MKASVSALLMLLAAITATHTRGAGADRHVDAKICQFYGFAPHTRAFLACLLNVRHYWSTGPCADWDFAALHRRYCNIIPELDF
jgi:hypothetical protein